MALRGEGNSCVKRKTSFKRMAAAKNNSRSPTQSRDCNSLLPHCSLLLSISGFLVPTAVKALETDKRSLGFPLTVHDKAVMMLQCTVVVIRRRGVVTMMVSRGHPKIVSSTGCVGGRFKVHDNRVPHITC